MNQEKIRSVLIIIGLLFGLLILPPLLQQLYGINAINTAFVVIMVYAFINWRMEKD